MSSCELPEFYAEDFPEARKTYRCCECEAPILPGEKHLHARGKSDGEFWHSRQHMLCRELCMLMNTESDGCCYFGGMKDEWHDGDWWHLDDTDKPPKSIARTLYARILKRERAAARVKP
jgi:hypothetical protein